MAEFSSADILEHGFDRQLWIVHHEPANTFFPYYDDSQHSKDLRAKPDFDKLNWEVSSLVNGIQCLSLYEAHNVQPCRYRSTLQLSHGLHAVALSTK